MASYERLGQNTSVFEKSLKVLTGRVTAIKEEIEKLRSARQEVLKKLQAIQEQSVTPVTRLALSSTKAILKGQLEMYENGIAKAMAELDGLLKKKADVQRTFVVSEEVEPVPEPQPPVSVPTPEPVVTEPVSEPVVTEPEPVEIARAGIIGKNLPFILISGLVLFTAYKLFFEKRTGSRA